MRNLSKLFSNKVLVYLASRYGTYALQFVVSLGVAAKLGPYYLGIYGFVTMVLSYFNQINFGISHSLNVLIVHHKNDKNTCYDYISNSLWIYTLIGLFILASYCISRIFDIELSQKYPIDNYVLLIVIVAIFTYLSSVMSTVLRARNKINHLTVVQSLNVVLSFISLLMFESEALIFALLFCQLISYIITFVITRKAKVLPSFSNIRIKIRVQYEILHKGFFLFLYNSCFYFILISLRTIVSDNYSIEEFGSFTFSFTIAHAVLLLLESLMTIIFPKIVDLLSTNNTNQLERTLESLRIAYISSSHFLIYLALLFFPLFTMFIPKYGNALTSMNLIALAILMNTNSCGYSTLLIAQNKEKISATISIIALVINVLLALFLARGLNVDFSYVVIATLITYLFFSLMVTYEGRKILGNRSLLINFFPIRLLIPYVLAFIISILNIELLIWLPLSIYVILNIHDLKSLRKMACKLIRNPNITDV